MTRLTTVDQPLLSNMQDSLDSEIQVVSYKLPFRFTLTEESSTFIITNSSRINKYVILTVLIKLSLNKVNETYSTLRAMFYRNIFKP
jgi:hypothetical protein